MTPDVYLSSLREVLDDYELDVAAARIRMQDRMRALIGIDVAQPIQQPADAERGPRTASATTPTPAEPQESAPDDAPTSVGIVGGPVQVEGTTAPPAATHRCPECQASLPTARGLATHRGLKHRSVHEPRRTTDEQPGQARKTELGPSTAGHPAPAHNPRSAPPLGLAPRADAVAGE